MEPEGSLPHSQQPAKYSYSNPDQSSPFATNPLPKIHCNVAFSEPCTLLQIREKDTRCTPFLTIYFT